MSSGDSTKVALPPSPGLAFQLAKNRYGREEMLAIYETIEKSLHGGGAPPPASLANDFDELYRRDVQRPILLSQPTPDEQVSFLSLSFCQSFRTYYEYDLCVCVCVCRNSCPLVSTARPY